MPMEPNSKDVPDVAWQYWGQVEFMVKNAGELGVTLYGLDDMRTKLHEKLCAFYGVTKEQSQVVTDNLDEYRNAVHMHNALKKLAL